MHEYLGMGAPAAGGVDTSGQGDEWDATLDIITEQNEEVLTLLCAAEAILADARETLKDALDITESAVADADYLSSIPSHCETDLPMALLQCGLRDRHKVLAENVCGVDAILETIKPILE